MANVFLKLTDVTAESQDQTHAEEIEVQSWSWGVSQSGTMHAGTGGGSPAMHVQDLSFTKFVDKASPVLMKFCANGKHIDEGILTIRKAGEDPQEFLIITMKHIIVSSGQTGGSGNDPQMIESYSLNFGEIHLEYMPQKEDGTLDAAVEFTIDIPANSVT
jgi:type VI secretion system secreted protein Hcp